MKIKESEIPPLDIPPEEAWARIMGPRPPHVPEELWAKGEAKMMALVALVRGSGGKPLSVVATARELRGMLKVLARIACCGGKQTARARAAALREIVDTALGPPH
jgi:hypothetical protein